MNVIFDPNNEIDLEIQKHITNYRSNGCQWQTETIIRFILNKRLVKKYRVHSKRKTNRTDELIENAIKKKIEKTGKSRDDIIREALCVHFDIPFTTEVDCAIHEKP